MVLYGYWLLAFCFFILVFVSYAWNRPSRAKIQPWPLLVDEAVTSGGACQSDKDCPLLHVCLDNECLPKLVPEDECWPATGSYNKVDIRGVAFAVCICLFPYIYSQKHYGGNCNLEVACGPHGSFDWKHRVCDCDYGYRPADGLDCVRELEAETSSCETDEIVRHDIRPEDGFSPEYLEQHKNQQCFKRPCTYDALTGRPLKDARYDPDFGCVCDPSVGQFGVRLPLNLVSAKGYNACASIFEHDDHPVDVDLYAYHYLLDRPPVAFLAFRNLDPHVLNPKLSAQGESLMIGQEFPHDYMQHLLNTRQRVGLKTRKRRCFVDTPLFSLHICNEWVYENAVTLSCDTIEDYVKRTRRGGRARAYLMLYEFPVCIEWHPEKKYVLNPHLLTFSEYPELLRSNGLVASHRVQEPEWKLDLAEPYNVRTYQDLMQV